MTQPIDRRTVLAAGPAVAAAALAPIGAQAAETYPEPSLHFVFQGDVQVAPPQEQGMVDGIRRRIVPITGGTVKGPRFSGVIMPGGADWQGIRPSDGLTRLFAHYWLRHDDGTTISVQNVGIRRAAPEVMKRLIAGEIVPSADYYFRAAPTFEVGAGPHAWLTESLFICVGARLPDRVIVRVYEVR